MPELAETRIKCTVVLNGVAISVEKSGVPIDQRLVPFSPPIPEEPNRQPVTWIRWQHSSQANNSTLAEFHFHEVRGTTRAMMRPPPKSLPI